MLSKFFKGILCLLVLFSLAALAGCGQTNSSSSSSSSSGNYTISGKLSSLSVSSVHTSASSTVTHIVAIDANGAKYLADLNANGTFSLKVNSGHPSVLGFYNKEGSAITLLGYLKQSDVGWNSLPIINPKDDSLDLGTVTIEASSKTATPSVDLSTLITKMNLASQATAAYYGSIDDNLVVLTNLDVDGNGLFDFQENKSYLFWADFGFKTSSQIQNMVGQYDDAYRPEIENYSYQLIFLEGSTSSTAGTSATLSRPSGSSLTGTAAANRTEWVFSFGQGITSPTQPPSGTYTAAVQGVGNYTLKNFQSSSVSTVGGKENIVYPVLKLTTDADGFVTKIDYKWKIVKSGTVTDVSSDEIRTVEDTALNSASGFIHGSPFFSFYFKDGTGTKPLQFLRDAGSLAITTVELDSSSGGTRKVLLSDLNQLSVTYNLTSRTVHRFWFN